MLYSTPVLQEVGHAAALVLGFQPISGENLGGTGATEVMDLALGLDDQ